MITLIFVPLGLSIYYPISIPIIISFSILIINKMQNRNFKKSVKIVNLKELYDLYVRVLVDIHAHNKHLYEKSSLIEPLQKKKKLNFWLEIKKSLTLENGLPVILKKYFIAKAKAKYQELKKQALKENKNFKELMKKVKRFF
jgi:hypothetical protein